MKKNNKQLIKIVNQNLDLIYKSCKKTARLWGENTIPLNYLNQIINLVKENVKKLPDELQEWSKFYIKMLDTFYSTCEEFAKKYNSSKIPLKILYYFLKILKEEFQKGFNEVSA